MTIEVTTEPATSAAMTAVDAHTRKSPKAPATHHLLSVLDLGRDGIQEVLRLTDSFVEVNERPIPKVPVLRGKTCLLYTSPSPRD